MKLKLTLLSLLFFLISCKKNPEKNSEKVQFNFDKFKIEKGKVGTVKIGMKLSEAEKEINGLSKNTCEASDFGFDGGGKAYIYSLKNAPVLALVPEFNSETIKSIIALNPKLKTKNGLNPNSTVNDILEEYPKLEVYQSTMMEWEYIDIEENNWYFVFQTDKTNLIGKYKKSNVPSKPIRRDVKMDWIEVN